MSHPNVPAAPAYVFQGREVTFPVVVRDASSGSATFLVKAAPARRLLPFPEIEIAEVAPGRALCSIAVIDYRDNDLGDYNEVSIAFFVRPRGAPRGVPYLGTWIDMVRGRLGTYIHHLPVDQSFTCEAGCSIWGFPKSVQEIDVRYGPSQVTCKLVYDGQHALTLSLPRQGNKSLPDREMTTYTQIEGVAHSTRFASGCEGFGVKLGGAELTLGSGRIADELRSLGLPRRALMCAWMEHMRGRFDPPDKL
jgi:hypothetical protein